MDPLPYIPGLRPGNPGLLSRFLPLVEEGTVSAWLAARLPPGSWLLDPFGTSPRLALEAARLGYRVLLTANNPIARFLVEMAAEAPAEADLKAALSDLAASRKSDERLETHLQSLYLTSCAKCGTEIPAREFLWNKEAETPYARIYECPHCQDEGEKPAAPADLERVKAIARSASLHRARILERIAPVGDADRLYAEEALQVYLPRAIYALATLINRLDGLDLPPERRRLVTALVLAAFDSGNSLWAADRPRPKQLSLSTWFRERNIWMALEAAVGQWSETRAPVACEAWPKKIPESGGICLYDGRLKDLADEVRKEIPIQAVIAALPRPNQAFWTLSALWAGWLWGREAAEPFKIGLRRRRYDWAWNATALSAAFRHLAGLLPEGTPMLALLAEPEAPFVSAAFTAADTTGFDLSSLALREEGDPLQTVWTHTDAARPAVTRGLEPLRRVIHRYLTERSEPAPYLHIHTAALADLAAAHALKPAEMELDDALRSTNTLVEAALTGDARFAHYGTGEGYETGFWGLHQYDPSIDSLADRVEMETVRLFQDRPERIFLEVESGLYSRFPSLHSPSKRLIYSVLYSYAEKEGSIWRLRGEDAPASRREDLSEMNALLETIGKRLGYGTIPDGSALVWERDGQTEFVFHVIASALLGRVVRANTHPPEKCVIVLPGGRGSLAAYKQERDPALSEKMREWRMLKFRLLRSLADLPLLNRQIFEEQIKSDPVEQAKGQLMMF